MSIPPISADVQIDFEKSCNMRCCICIFPRRGTPKVTIQTETSPIISELALDRLRHIADRQQKIGLDEKK